MKLLNGVWKMNNVNDLDELIALIKYLVNHNKSHNEELKELASKLKDNEAYNDIVEAISIYDKANLKLEDALKKVKK